MMTDGVGSSGYSVDYFRSVAKRMGRTGIIRELPWARCLLNVASGRVDVAVDAYDDAARRQQYLYSTPYYTLTPQVFYRSNGKAMVANSAGELAANKGCGVFGYTYAHYGLDATQMDLSAKSDKQMFLMLFAGRCDYAVEELEYVIGGRGSEKDWPEDSELQSFRPQWAQAPQLHYLIGRKHPNAQQLHTAINLAIRGIQKSGEDTALGASYFSEVPAPSKIRGLK
jgi:polar amino acid transport system substrate-binding protein